MSFGIGMDILEIRRFRAVVQRRGLPFLEKILTPQERAYCFQYKDPIPNCTVRFCAKEAIVKALGYKIGSTVGWLDIDIIHGSEGKPIVTFSENVNHALHFPSVIISLTHSQEYASAVALLIPKQ